MSLLTLKVAVILIPASFGLSLENWTALDRHPNKVNDWVMRFLRMFQRKCRRDRVRNENIRENRGLANRRINGAAPTGMIRPY